VARLRDIDGCSLFEVALECKLIDVVEYLIQFDDTLKHPTSLESIICVAVKSGVLKFVELLHSKKRAFFTNRYKHLYKLACEHGHLEIMQFLRSASRGQFDLDDALRIACRYGHAHVARELIDLGANVHCVDPQFILGLAHHSGHVKDKDMMPVYSVLIDSGCLIDPSRRKFWDIMSSCETAPFVEHVLSLYTPTDANVRSAVEKSCFYGCTDTLRLFLDISAQRGIFGQNKLLILLRDALCREHPHISTGSLLLSRIDINELSSADSSEVLFFAVQCDYREMVLELLDRGQCDVNKVSFRHCNWSTRINPWINPKVRILSQASDPAVVQLLLDAKAEAHHTDCRTILEAACIHLRPDAVSLLMKAGAPTQGYERALTLAIQAPCTDARADDKIAVLTQLIKAGAAVDDDDNRRFSLDVCKEASPDSHKYITALTLLKNDPDLWKGDEKDRYRYPRQAPVELQLLAACQEPTRDPAYVRALVDAGVNVNTMDIRNNSRTPLDYLLYNRHQSPRQTSEILKMLLNAGVDIMCDNLLLMKLVRSLPDSACSVYINDILEAMLHGSDAVVRAYKKARTDGYR
jgi:hypothetical protein